MKRRHLNNRADRTEKRRKIAAMKAMGWSYVQIGALLHSERIARMGRAAALGFNPAIYG